MAMAENLAEIIRKADTWTQCVNEIEELCDLADLGEKWREADGETFENVIREASEKLGVDCGL